MSVSSTRVFVLGAGPVATSLACSLRLAGTEMVGMWGRNKSALDPAAALAQVDGFSGSQPPLAELQRAGLVILAVRDAAISEVASTLAKGGYLAHAPILLHCSGAVSAEEALHNAAGLAGGIGLLHPLRALAPGVLVESFAGTTFGIQGDAAGRAAAEELCRTLSGRPLLLEAHQMAGYHTAAVMASNYAVALMDVALTLVAKTGLDPEAARSGLMELAQGALAGVGEKGTLQALTGPIRRGDLGTVQGHLGIINDRLPEAAELYRALGDWTLDMARKCKDAPEAELDEIKHLFAKTE